MKKRRKKKDLVALSPGPNDSFNTPFAGLGEMLKQAEVDSQPVSGEETPGEEVVEQRGSMGQSESNLGAEEGDSLFREAMAGVEPLRCNTVKPRAPGPL